MAARRLVILGGGFAGLRALFRLKDVDGLEIVLVDARPTSLLKPALPGFVFSGRDMAHARFALAPVARRLGARFVHARAERIDPAARRVRLADGASLAYDHLLLALGAHKDYDAIPGYREHGHSPCDDHEAQRMAEALRRFGAGPVVVGSASSQQGTRVPAPRLAAACEGPVGEAAFMLDRELRHRGVRERSPVRVFSPGRVFFEDVGPRVHAVLERALAEHEVEVGAGRGLARIHADAVEFEDGDRWPSVLSVVIPPYAGPALVRHSEGLGDECGFVPTDSQMRHLDFPQILAAGDGTALSVPKLGHLAVHQADIAAATLRRDLTGEGEIPEFAPEIFCILDSGGLDATLILSNHLYGGDVDVAFSSPLAHLMKWGFDSYTHFTQGRLPPDFAQRALIELVKRAAT